MKGSEVKEECQLCKLKDVHLLRDRRGECREQKDTRTKLEELSKTRI